MTTQLNTTLFVSPVTARGQVGRLTWISDSDVTLEGIAATGLVGDVQAVVGDNSVQLHGLQAVGQVYTFGIECDVVLPAVAVTGYTVAFSVQSSDYPDGNIISSSIRPSGVAGIGRANPVYVMAGEVLIVVLA